MSSSIMICASPSSTSSSLTHPASRSRSRRRPGSRGRTKSPAASASFATSSATRLRCASDAAQFGPFAVSGNQPRPKRTRSPSATVASRLPISLASASASRDHCAVERITLSPRRSGGHAADGTRPASATAARMKRASAIGPHRAGVARSTVSRSTEALCALIADRTASVMAFLASAMWSFSSRLGSSGSPGFGSDPGRPMDRVMNLPTYPTPANSARSNLKTMLTRDVSPGTRSSWRYVSASRSAVALPPLKSAYASFTQARIASRARSRSTVASFASLSAPPTPRPVTSSTSSMDGAVSASSNMPASAPSTSRCCTGPKYSDRSRSSSRRLSSWDPSSSSVADVFPSAPSRIPESTDPGSSS
mmetsp:Transcript_11226/g.52111  ORF Transcript_11226/g.52111 Transcript_11226/m.52111 type:complete len:364 (-) Transcript_11226:303-1394(-)